MKYLLDSDGYIESFATVGDLEGSLEYTGELPEDFTYHFSAYQLVNGTLVKDAEKAAALDSETLDSVDEVTLLLAQVEALSARNDFMEDCIAEMAMQVYS